MFFTDLDWRGRCLILGLSLRSKVKIEFVLLGLHHRLREHIDFLE